MATDERRLARSRSLLGAFPLAVMTIAAFAVVFALMMARLGAGADPAMRLSTHAGVISRSSAGGSLRTRPSGTGGSSSTGAPVSARSIEPPAIVTRSSAFASAEGSRDD